jgi:hypothetical protein
MRETQQSSSERPSLPSRASSIGVVASVTPLHPSGNSEAAATEDRAGCNRTCGDSVAPSREAAVAPEAPASAKEQSAPADQQCCSRVLGATDSSGSELLLNRYGSHRAEMTAPGVIRQRTPDRPTPALPSSGASRSRRRLSCCARRAGRVWPGVVALCARGDEQGTGVRRGSWPAFVSAGASAPGSAAEPRVARRRIDAGASGLDPSRDSFRTGLARRRLSRQLGNRSQCRRTSAPCVWAPDSRRGSPTRRFRS